ncbi:MAG: TetR/AcrR family transcriptional regulator [Kofleriaceae bacterium]|nr:TetR/AcrR family transcriptional regulator [Kofleriaceae bacterium]
MSNAHDLRRKPEQARSRDRVNTILAAACRLIVRQGHAPLKMSDLAKEAKVSLPSIYRYFPDKKAIVRALATASYEKAHQQTADSIAQLAEGATIEEVCTTRLHMYFQLVRKDPIERYLRAAVLSDPELEELDLDAARQDAAMIEPLLQIHFGELKGKYGTAELALLLTYLAGASARLASLVEDEEGDRLEAAYIAVALRMLHIG